jgi:hypothetical protein
VLKFYNFPLFPFFKDGTFDDENEATLNATTHASGPHGGGHKRIPRFFKTNVTGGAPWIAVVDDGAGNWAWDGEEVSKHMSKTRKDAELAAERFSAFEEFMKAQQEATAKLQKDQKAMSRSFDDVKTRQEDTSETAQDALVRANDAMNAAAAAARSRPSGARRNHHQRYRGAYGGADVEDSGDDSDDEDLDTSGSSSSDSKEARGTATAFRARGKDKGVPAQLLIQDNPKANPPVQFAGTTKTTRRGFANSAAGEVPPPKSSKAKRIS